MGMGNEQLVSEESCPKRLVHRRLRGYCGESRPMILGGLVRTVLRWSGATCRIALSFHLRLLAPGVGARSLPWRWLNLFLLSAWDCMALANSFFPTPTAPSRSTPPYNP